MELYQHQKRALSDAERFSRVAVSLTWGWGKTL